MAGDAADPIPDGTPGTDAGRPAAGAEDPNTLLTSANEASGPARNAWLAFLGLIAYLLVTLAGVTHVDLLLNSPVTLPIVNVKIPLFSFFVFAPFLLLLVHLGLLVQHAMLAHKYQHFCAELATPEAQSPARPDRKIVHSYVFSQMLAGSRPPWPLFMLMRVMVYFSLVVLPVLVLLYFQVKFLPYHDVAITHAHRLAVFLDLALLFVVWPFIDAPATRPHKKTLGFGNEDWRWQANLSSLGAAAAVCLAVLFFSVAVATVPHGCFWVYTEGEETCFSLDRTMAQWSPVEVESGARRRMVFAPTKWLFEGTPDAITSTADSLFSRNLVVTDNKTLVNKKNFREGETSLNLRGRNLRFSVLDRSDLRRADLVGSDLRGVSAKGTTLDHAVLDEAQMQGATLGFAHLQGADLINTQLQGAVLVAAQLQGANLSGAQLQGSDLGLAHLQGADLIKAQMQGADLYKAHLLGADLREAQLQGAVLLFARLFGANLAAFMDAADLGGARIWQTNVPRAAASAELALTQLSVYPIYDLDLKTLSKWISNVKDNTLRQRLEERLGPLLNVEMARDWKNSEDHRIWASVSTYPEPDASALADYLVDLACTDESGGYIIRGIARRVVFFAQKNAGHKIVFQGTARKHGWLGREINLKFPKLTAGKLVNSETCGATRHLGEETLANLKEIAGSVKSDSAPVTKK